MPRTAARLLRVFIPFAFGYFLSYLFRTVNAVIAPDLAADAGLDPAALGLLTSAYFLTFAAFQLPLGVLLDRFGPRRVEASLLVVAAAGALVFARAEGVTGLVIGRALIGLGVSACLMAAFKAFSSWLPPERLPLANAVQMVSGGIGALTATAPVEAALRLTDWRGVFLILAALTLLAALAIFLVVPERPDHHSGETLGEALRGVTTIYTSRSFWRLAPWAILTQAAYLSIQGLWSGPWLRDVAGLERTVVAEMLLLVAAAMIIGFFAFGALTDHLSRRGVTPIRVAAAGMTAFMAVQLLLLGQWNALTIPLWFLFGLSGTSAILPYAILSQTFPRHLAGRANTALNLPVFLAAFAVQWGIGVLISAWPETATGYHPNGYRAAFGLLLLLQGGAALWFWWDGRKKPEPAKITLREGGGGS
jgi:predicted MFS family arabinose efflux permease